MSVFVCVIADTHYGDAETYQLFGSLGSCGAGSGAGRAAALFYQSGDEAPLGSKGQRSYLHGEAKSVSQSSLRSLVEELKLREGAKHLLS